MLREKKVEDNEKTRYETADGSYIHNCFIKRRLDDTSDSLFTIPGDGLTMITKLDGYAIIPIEEYEELSKR